MKKLSRTVILFTIFVMMSLVFALPANAASSPKLNKTSTAVTVGYSTTLKVLNKVGTVKWVSGNTNVAKVTRNGVVKGVKPGKTTVSAIVNRRKLVCKVTVRANAYTIAHVSINQRSNGINFVTKSYAFNNKGQLVVTGYLVNMTDRCVYRMSNIRLTVYMNGALVAAGSFAPISGILQPYKYTGNYYPCTFTLSRANVRRKIDLAKLKYSDDYFSNVYN